MRARVRSLMGFLRFLIDFSYSGKQRLIMPTHRWGRKAFWMLMLVVMTLGPMLGTGLMTLKQLPSFLLYAAAGFIVVVLSAGCGVLLGHALNRLIERLIGRK